MTAGGGAKRDPRRHAAPLAHAGNVTVKEGETARFQVTVTPKCGDGASSRFFPA